MRKLLLALVYTALAAGANAADVDPATLESLRDGSMKRLAIHAEPRKVATGPFRLQDGGRARLSDYRGKTILLNFWATWCAPCRKEMPQLAALQARFQGDGFEVVTLATGRNSPEGIARFFAEIGVDNLPGHRDPDQKIARDMKVLGLPVTVLIDHEGREIARLVGDADWDSASARAIVAALVE